MFFFFNDTATTEIYTLSLHDALPISISARQREVRDPGRVESDIAGRACDDLYRANILAHGGNRYAAQQELQLLCHRSEEHTSELQSRRDLVCRLLLEKKKKK